MPDADASVSTAQPVIVGQEKAAGPCGSRRLRSSRRWLSSGVQAWVRCWRCPHHPAAVLPCSAWPFLSWSSVLKRSARRGMLACTSSSDSWPSLLASAALKRSSNAPSSRPWRVSRAWLHFVLRHVAVLVGVELVEPFVGAFGRRRRSASARDTRPSPSLSARISSRGASLRGLSPAIAWPREQRSNGEAQVRMGGLHSESPVENEACRGSTHRRRSLTRSRGQGCSR